MLDPSRGEQDSQLGSEIILVFKTFDQISVKHGHWDIRVWYYLTQNLYRKGHESILVGRYEGVAFKYGMCEGVWDECEKYVMGWMKWWGWKEKEKGEGGRGEKERNLTNQVQGHLYQNEPRANNFASQNIQTRQTQSINWGHLFTEVYNTFVIVTAHKQVCANQKITSQSHILNAYLPTGMVNFYGAQM